MGEGRVFKKSSPDCKLKVYLGKQDIVAHLDKVTLWMAWCLWTLKSALVHHTAARPRGHREGLCSRL
uniref:Uncharacterized protein n=1 Tax=Neovison vison TaxID=452646 RepID=A0A8C7A1V9_NEOVI